MSTYFERVRNEFEDKFVAAAADRIAAGDVSWQRFAANHSQFDEPVFRAKFEAMVKRRDASKKGTFSIESEMQLVRDRRNREATAAFAEKQYQDLRGDLLEAANDHRPWSRVKRELQLFDDSEPLYRRAQSEVGTTKATEAPDPLDKAFLLGMNYER